MVADCCDFARGDRCAVAAESRAQELRGARVQPLHAGTPSDESVASRDVITRNEVRLRDAFCVVIGY